MLISEAKFNQKIFIYLDQGFQVSPIKTETKFPGVVVAETTNYYNERYQRNGFKLVGFKIDEIIKDGDVQSPALNLNNYNATDHYTWLPEVKEYPFTIWVRGDYECCPYIFNEKQICKSCRRPAPHIEPNLPNNLFICKSCKYLEGI